MKQEFLINTDNTKSQKNIAILVYILQAISLFLVITFVIAVIINYVKKSDAKNTWVESHFRWQIRTFWFAMLWFAIGSITMFIGIGFIILTVNVIWIIYRVVKGWFRLNDGKEMYS